MSGHAAAVPARQGALRIARSFAWYPTELAATYVLSVFFTSGVSPFAMFRPLLIACAITLLVTVVLTVVLRDPGRGGIATLLAGLAIGMTAFPFALPFVLAAAVLAVVFDRLPHRRTSWATVSGWLEAFSTLLLAVVVVQGIATGRVARAIDDVRPQEPVAVPSAVAAAHRDDPDVYLIVLDGYARSDALASDFGLDDTAFLDFLRSRGFDVAARSTSEYADTASTFASMLNMAPLEALPSLASVARDTSAANLAFHGAIDRNAVFRRYRELGYSIVATASGFDEVSVRGADAFLDDGQLGSFETRLLVGSGVGNLVEFLAPSFVGDQLRSRVESIFRQLASVARTPSAGPRLVIGHVLSPHPPALFGAHGEPLPVALHGIYSYADTGLEGRAHDRTAYADQVRYLDERLEVVIDGILSASRRPPVIIVMSDHGSRFPIDAGAAAPVSDDYKSFFAALTPGRPDVFGAESTPSSVFDRLLHAYEGVAPAP
jgi:hypothetical protein